MLKRQNETIDLVQLNVGHWTDKAKLAGIGLDWKSVYQYIIHTALDNLEQQWNESSMPSLMFQPPRVIFRTVASRFFRDGDFKPTPRDGVTILIMGKGQIPWLDIRITIRSLSSCAKLITWPSLLFRNEPQQQAGTVRMLCSGMSMSSSIYSNKIIHYYYIGEDGTYCCAQSVLCDNRDNNILLYYNIYYEYILLCIIIYPYSTVTCNILVLG